MVVIYVLGMVTSYHALQDTTNLMLHVLLRNIAVEAGVSIMSV